MNDRIPPTLDMRLDGSFRTPPRAGVPVSAKLLVGAAITAVIAGSLAMAALAIWVVSMLLPVLIAACVVAWGAMQFRKWRMGQGGHSVRRY